MRTMIFVFTLIAFWAAPAWAQDFAGWCYDAGECVGEDRLGSGYLTQCEATCTLTNPVNIRGLDAVLFDSVCEGEYTTGFSERVLIITFGTDENPGGSGLMITAAGETELYRCDN